jgi:hypothetical protein
MDIPHVTGNDRTTFQPNSVHAPAKLGGLRAGVTGDATSREPLDTPTAVIFPKKCQTRFRRPLAQCKNLPKMRRSMVQEKHFIPDTTRARLVALGVPLAKHAPEALADLFPAEFNIDALGLNTEDLARVLIHFVGQKIISLPDKKSPFCTRKVEPGWHACHFYRDFEQLLDIIAPYVAEGLQNGEACLWVMPAAVTTQAAGQAVARGVGDIDPYLASGQLEMLSHPDWYLDATGRLKSFEEIGAALIAKQDRALAKGFKFLRAAGDTGWVSCTEQSKHFIDYENKVNAALQATKVAAVCTYRGDVTADELIAIVNAHQDSFYSATVPPSAS